MCCSMLQRVAVCCGVLQCVTLDATTETSLWRCSVCCSMLQCVAACCGVLWCVAVIYRVLQCVAVCCSVLQLVTAYCSELQRVAVFEVRCPKPDEPTEAVSVLQHVAGCCSVLQGVAGCCRVLQRVAACCSVLQCVTLDATNKTSIRRRLVCCSVLQCVAVCCSLLQCVAAYYLRCYERDKPTEAVRVLRLAKFLFFIYTEHDSFMYVTCRIRICDMTHSYTRHDSFI